MLKEIKNMMPLVIISGSTAANQVHLRENIWGLTTVKSINLHAQNPKKGC